MEGREERYIPQDVQDGAAQVVAGRSRSVHFSVFFRSYTLYYILLHCIFWHSLDFNKVLCPAMLQHSNFNRV